MRKITLFFFAVFASFAINAQEGPATSGGAGNTGAMSQVSFGAIGAAWEFPVAAQISIAPFAATNFDLNRLTVGVKANYYFDKLFGLPAAWDVYGGANAGYAVVNNGTNDDIGLGLHIGGRWFWSQKWGLYLEGGGGMGGSMGGLGVTMRL